MKSHLFYSPTMVEVGVGRQMGKQMTGVLLTTDNSFYITNKNLFFLKALDIQATNFIH